MTDLHRAQVLLSKMLNITAHWHSNPMDCSKCRTVDEAVAFLQDTGYGRIAHTDQLLPQSLSPEDK